MTERATSVTHAEYEILNWIRKRILDVGNESIRNELDTSFSEINKEIQEWNGED